MLRQRSNCSYDKRKVSVVMSEPIGWENNECIAQDSNKTKTFGMIVA